MSEYESSLDGEMYTLQSAFSEDAYTQGEYTELIPVGIKKERASPYPTENPKSRRRPGRAPARQDDDLNNVERERLVRRRERNRHAAARCRERRMAKVGDLEGQVSELTSAKEKLLTENERLQKEIENMRFQLNVQIAEDEKVFTTEPVACTDEEMFPALKQLENLPIGPPKTAVLFTPGGTFSLTPLSLATNVFNFPSVGRTEIQNTDVAEFTKTLAVL